MSTTYQRITEVLLQKCGNITEETATVPSSLSEEFASKLEVFGVPAWMAHSPEILQMYRQASTPGEKQQVVGWVAKGYRQASQGPSGTVRSTRSFVEAVTGEAPRMSRDQVRSAGLEAHEKDWLDLLSQVQSEADIPEIMQRAEALLRNQFDRKGILTPLPDPMAAQASESFVRRLSGQPIRESVSRSGTSAFVKQLS